MSLCCIPDYQPPHQQLGRIAEASSDSRYSRLDRSFSYNSNTTDRAPLLSRASSHDSSCSRSSNDRNSTNSTPILHHMSSRDSSRRNSSDTNNIQYDMRNAHNNNNNNNNNCDAVQRQFAPTITRSTSNANCDDEDDDEGIYVDCSGLYGRLADQPTGEEERPQNDSNNTVTDRYEDYNIKSRAPPQKDFLIGKKITTAK